MLETYTGKERRSTERDGTNFTEEQMEGAGIRLIKERKTIDGSGFTEGDLMRDAIKTRLGVVSATTPAPSAAPGNPPAETAKELAESQETPEFSLEQFVEAAYDKAVGALTDGRLCTPKEIPPSKEEVLAKLRTLSPEKLEVVREMKVPMLVVEPKGLSYKRFMKNLDTGTKTRNETFITDSRKKQFALQDKALGIKGDGAVAGWTIGIAEGAEELDSEYGYLRDLTAKWKKGAQATRGAVLVDHTKFALMQKQAIMSGKRLDQINWSVLSRRDNNNETVCEDGLVSGGAFLEYYDYVHFVEAYPYDLYLYARFRAVVIA
ncbi:MAG: hypothetical protein WC604_00325 [Candidatus Gracilibacteria bacterium]